MYEIKTIMISLFMAVLTIGIPIIMKTVVALVKNKISKIEDDTIVMYLDKAIDIIASSVVTINQTYVDNLKAIGKFDKGAQETAFNKAKEIALSLITDKMRDAVEFIYGDLDKFLNVKIEEIVNLNKEQVVENVE